MRLHAGAVDRAGLDHGRGHCCDEVSTSELDETSTTSTDEPRLELVEGHRTVERTPERGHEHLARPEALVWTMADTRDSSTDEVGKLKISVAHVLVLQARSSVGNQDLQSDVDFRLTRVAIVDIHILMMTTTNTATENNTWIIVRSGLASGTRALYWTGEEWVHGYKRAQVFESQQEAETLRTSKGWRACTVVPFEM